MFLSSVYKEDTSGIRVLRCSSERKAREFFCGVLQEKRVRRSERPSYSADFPNAKLGAKFWGLSALNPIKSLSNF